MLIEFTDKGLYCSRGGFYIDPWKPVAKAVITHAHSDHAKPGNEYYLCHRLSKPLLQLRLGDNHYESKEWNEAVYINGVKVSLHPAGHIIGSSQVRIEYNGEVCVVSGDYKTEDDSISGAFESLRCNTFITESTFGLPIYNWKPQHEMYSDMQNWIANNIADGCCSILFAYSLGKSQRVLEAASAVTNNIYVHGAVWNVHQTLLNAGIALPHVKRITPDITKEELKNAVVIAPSSAKDSPWLKRFTPYKTGMCSGWMQVRGNVRRNNLDAGFALSDHADWKSLLQTVTATGAEKIFVTHGFQSAFTRYLNEKGFDAAEVKTEYGEEEPEGETAIETIDNTNSNG